MNKMGKVKKISKPNTEPSFAGYDLTDEESLTAISNLGWILK